MRPPSVIEGWIWPPNATPADSISPASVASRVSDAIASHSLCIGTKGLVLHVQIT